MRMNHIVSSLSCRVIFSTHRMRRFTMQQTPIRTSFKGRVWNSGLRSSKSANNSKFRSVPRVHDLTHLIVNSTRGRLATARQPLVLCSFRGSYCSLLSEESQTIAAQPEFHLTLLWSPKSYVAGQKKPKFSNPASNKLHWTSLSICCSPILLKF